VAVSKLDVAVLMGSTSDWKHMKAAVEVLRELGLECRVHVTSAHRTPERTLDIIRTAEADGCSAFICGAGMAAHLAGVVASHTLRPVLGVPLPGGVLDGVDALLSTVQMPGGIPVATFAVGSAGAKNAAYFASQIVALTRPEAAARLADGRSASSERVADGERQLLEELGGGTS
jgi:5-(carboxyamino)imidazole ribonucleotide mutase